ncbi:uncharacterized protein LOC120800011 isoform X2 [Xiphias gladius]|nr:uncharacterized protein LOC120800011 isoform X2 [Xiphias gladius]
MMKNLTGTEGGNITLPYHVVQSGFLSFGANVIANVRKGEIQILEEMYRNRLLWNKDTGFFTLTGLQRNDSGNYALSSTILYKLTVYGTVPMPAVKKLRVSTESCTLLCFVDKAEETTLLWYKDEEILNQNSSALFLPLTVHKQDFNSSYRCVAANPAEKKNLSFNIKTSCSGQDHTYSRDGIDKRIYISQIAIPILSLVMLTLVAIITKKKCLDKNMRSTRQTQGSVNTAVHDTDLHIREKRHSQGESLLYSSGTVDCSHLTTVYDKLEAHRMVPIQTATDDKVLEQTTDLEHTAPVQ